MVQFGSLSLAIDAGNTCTKAALFDGTELLRHAVVDAGSPADSLAAFCGDARPQRCAIACVSGRQQELAEAARRLGTEPLMVDGTTPAPLQNCYHTPLTLGADRWAAAVGARSLQSEGALLVVDAGTCVTYDFVDADSRYLGGNISPGLEMRLRAMHEHTARLPLVGLEGRCPELGDDTETALRAGAVCGLRYEIERYVELYAGRCDHLTVFLTGGIRPDTGGLTMVREDKHLVARGLNTILRHTYEP